MGLWRMDDHASNEKTPLGSVMSALIVGNSPLGITAYASSGQCVLANQAAATLVGGTEEQLLSQNFRQIRSWQDTGLTDWAEKALALDTEQTTEITLTTTFDKRISLRCRFVPFQFQDEKHLMLMYEDISAQKQAEAALMTSEARFKGLFNSMSNGVAVYSAVDDGQDFFIIDFNSAAEEIENVKRAHVVGRRVTEVFPGVVEFGLLDVFQRVWRTGQHEHHPISMYQDERITGWRENQVYKLRSGEIVAVYADVTEQKQAEEAMTKSEQRYRTLFENASDGILLMQGMTFIDCNSRVLERFACRKDQILGNTPLDISPPYQPDGHSSQEKAKALVEAALNGHPQRFEWQHILPDGTYFDAEVSLNRLEFSGQALMLALVRDITERKKAEKRLAEYQERLRSLASELSLAEERLRRQVATWLHDHACQNLALVKLMLQNLQAALSSPHRESASEITEMVDQVLLLLRDLTFDLSPPTLYMFGLEAAVEKLLEEQLGSKQEIEYHLVRDKEAVSLPEDIRVLLYQSIRELIINITKHAQATEVSITIDAFPDTVRITVQDNGVGFDTSQMEISQTKGFGLFNIRERLRHAGGQFQLESQAGQGSRFTLLAPLEPTDDAGKTSA
jgi:PAS domain S-box-containing protein